ncbi:hypothetical protein AA313_de0207121 [Arthrobotrys entomopaga]|nr:hypothetical protein AA313_de0207121 [Arthrobotrys entomopaga]
MFGQAMVNALKDNNVDGAKLYEILMKVCATWEKSALEKSKDSENYEVGEAARRVLDETAQVILDHAEDTHEVAELMQSLLAQLQSGDESTEEVSDTLTKHPLAEVPLNSVFSLSMSALSSNDTPGSNKRDSQIVPWLSRDASFSPKMLNKSFLDLAKTDPANATALSEKLTAYSVKVQELWTLIGLIDVKMATAITTVANISEVSKQLPYCLKQFLQNLPSNSEPLGPLVDDIGRDLLLKSWVNVLGDIQQVVNRLEGKVSASENLDVSDIVASYTEVPRISLSHLFGTKKPEPEKIRLAIRNGKVDSGTILEVFGAPTEVTGILDDLRATLSSTSAVGTEVAIGLGIDAGRSAKVMVNEAVRAGKTKE